MTRVHALIQPIWDYANEKDESKRAAIWAAMNNLQHHAANRVIIMESYRTGIVAVGETNFYARNALQEKLKLEDDFFNRLCDALTLGKTNITEV